MKFLVCCYIIITSFTSMLLFQDSELKESMKRGSEIYADFCVNCHMKQGEGVEMAFPPLAKSDYLMKNRAASIRGIKYGQTGEIIVNGKVYNSTMSPMGLEDEEIADVMNFISNSWGNSADKIVTKEEVKAIQKNSK